MATYRNAGQVLPPFSTNPTEDAAEWEDPNLDRCRHRDRRRSRNTAFTACTTPQKKDSPPTREKAVTARKRLHDIYDDERQTDEEEGKMRYKKRQMKSRLQQNSDGPGPEGVSLHHEQVRQAAGQHEEILSRRSQGDTAALTPLQTDEAVATATAAGSPATAAGSPDVESPDIGVTADAAAATATDVTDVVNDTATHHDTATSTDVTDTVANAAATHHDIADVADTVAAITVRMNAARVGLERLKEKHREAERLQAEYRALQAALQAVIRKRQQVQECTDEVLAAQQRQRIARLQLDKEDARLAAVALQLQGAVSLLRQLEQTSSSECKGVLAALHDMMRSI